MTVRNDGWREMPPKNATPVLTPAEKAARTRALKKAARKAEEIATRARATEEASGAGKRLNKTADGRVIMNVYLKQLFPPATVHHTHYDEYTVPEHTIIIEKILEENDHTRTRSSRTSSTTRRTIRRQALSHARTAIHQGEQATTGRNASLSTFSMVCLVPHRGHHAGGGDKATGKFEAGGNRLARWKNLAIKFAFDAMKDPAEHDSSI
jgi:hypothetical protein